MKDTEINNFLQWFGNLKEIPLQTRHDFFQHVSEIGGLDSKSIEFIEQTLSRIGNKYEKQQLELEHIAKKLNVTLKSQKEPKLSIKEKIVQFTTKLMFDRVERFKDYFNRIKKIELKSQESAEDLEDSAQIARLKAAL